jgi:hypothetical protein
MIPERSKGKGWDVLQTARSAGRRSPRRWGA